MEAPLKTVWSGYYLNGREPTRHDVTVTVMGSGIQIVRREGQALWWPYDQLRQTQGFYSGEQVRLEKGEGLPEALVVADAAFLNAIRRVSPELGARFRLPIRGSLWLRRALLIGAAAMALGSALYLWGLPALADVVASHVPVSWEEQLGQAVVEQLAPPSIRCTDSGGIQALDQIVSTLAAAGPQSPYRFRITVVNDAAVNAFAAPGGHLFLYRGLLQKTKSPEELAGVLAHEIQHVLQRHATKALLREMSLKLLFATLAGDTTDMSRALEAAGTLGALRYRRRDEDAADREGMKLVQAARIDPKGMISFLMTLSEERGSSRATISYLSTHPAIEDRLEQLKRLAAKARYTPIRLLPDYPWAQIGKIC